MRDVISLHIGQSGIQIGNALWDLYCAEHDINPDGTFSLDYRMKNQIGFGSFFQELSNGHYTPRAVLIDLEPTVIDEIKGGKSRELYTNNSFVQGKEDAANNYARGYYTVGRQMMETTLEAIRNKYGSCEQCQGFMIFHSLGGGTGSGFTSYLIEELMNEYPKKGLLEVAIFPSPAMSPAVVEPYNTVLSTSATMENSKCVVLMDNESLYKICTNQLEMDCPNYNSINGVLSQAVSSMTTGLRFEADLMADFLDFQTNLVPFPRLHFPIVSIAPVIGNKKLAKEPSNVIDITSKCFDPMYRLTNCGNEWGKYISCCLLYRGDVTPKDINESIGAMKRKRSISFVDWCLTGFKVSFNFQPPVSLVEKNLMTVRRSVCMLCNNSSLKDSWQTVLNKFNAMKSKGAFYHWYLGEGMDEQEFIQAGENISALVKDYNEIAV